MEEKKNNSILLIIIAVLLMVICGVGGYYLGNKASKADEEKTQEKSEDKKEEKKENKEPEKEPGKEKEKEPEKENGDEQEYRICNICNIDDNIGYICCGTGTVEASVLEIKAKGHDNAVDDVDTITTEEAELTNSGNKIKVKYSKNNNAEKVIVNGKTIYEGSYLAVREVGLLDNGMIVIRYNDYADQFSDDDRIYYDSKLNRIGIYQWVTSDSLLSKEFTYVKDQTCEGENTRVYKIYKVTLSSGKATEKLEKENRTEDGCAGLT